MAAAAEGDRGGGQLARCLAGEHLIAPGGGQRPAVAAADPVTGEAITYRVGEDGAITGASHPDSALSFLRPGQPWGDDVMTTFCHYLLHFTGPATGQRWTAAHPGTVVISLGDAAELARRHAARPSAPGPHDQARPGASGALAWGGLGRALAVC